MWLLPLANTTGVRQPLRENPRLRNKPREIANVFLIQIVSRHFGESIKSGLGDAGATEHGAFIPGSPPRRQCTWHGGMALAPQQTGCQCQTTTDARLGDRWAVYACLRTRCTGWNVVDSSMPQNKKTSSQPFLKQYFLPVCLHQESKNVTGKSTGCA